jgi:hypothetical protein
MLHVRLFAIVAISLICVGCTVTRERAVRVATRALADRKLPLPAKHTVEVTEGRVAIYAGGGYDLGAVLFSVPSRSEPIYIVSVDQRFGTVDDVEDHRSSSSRR